MGRAFGAEGESKGKRNGEGQQQVPFGNDNKRQEQRQQQTQIPFGNDKQKGNSTANPFASLRDDDG